ncbi:hypothetical protein LIER_19208 [Lithospermum erythrorhizon]|uniref:Uncharacterized protein n=1 Tax=Lithospermum erythrorhizon TaxID=34254 RepID=A0AAV3QJZ0_LITER
MTELVVGEVLAQLEDSQAFSFPFLHLLCSGMACFFGQVSQALHIAREVEFRRIYHVPSLDGLLHESRSMSIIFGRDGIGMSAVMHVLRFTIGPL